MSKKHAETIEENAQGVEKTAPVTESEELDETMSPSDSSEDQDQLTKELERIRQEKDDYYNRMLRIQADFDNFRRRSRQEYEQVCLYGGEDILKKILPVLDSLERAVNCFTSNDPENCSWQDGVQLTLKQFQNILTAEGLEAVASINQPFDPQVHEAVMQEASVEVSEPIVVMELQKGYKFKNKLIRPALVKVAVPQ